MKFLIRKQLNSDIGTLGSGSNGVADLSDPGSTSGGMSVDFDDDDLPDLPSAGGTTNPPVTPPASVPPIVPGSQPTNTNGTEKETTDTDPGTTGGVDESETAIFEQAIDELGYEVDLEITPDLELTTFGKAYYEAGGRDAVKKEYEELTTLLPETPDLVKFVKQHPGATLEDFVSSRTVQAPLSPDQLTVDNTDVHKSILINNFKKLGMDEETAEAMAQGAVDSNTSLKVATKILEQQQRDYIADKANRDAAAAVKAKEDYDKVVLRAQEGENRIRTGTIMGVKIPVAKQEQFILDNYYDAGDPNHPGLSAVDIKMKSLSQEQIDLYRYLVATDFNINELVQARATTLTTAQRLQMRKQAGSTKMSGGVAASKSGDTDDDLDDPV